MKNIAYKYRIYPTTEQRIFFAKTFGCCRKVYNLMLADKIAHYNATGKSLTTTPAKYKKDYPFLKEVDSLALANVQLDLQQAYKNFFRDKNVGFPKFKSSKHSRRSYTTNNQNGTVAIQNSYIRLPKIGLVKAKLHRLPKEAWVLKSATISQDKDGRYYASLLFAYDEEPVMVTAAEAIGLDYSSAHLYVDSNGVIGYNHKFFRESQKKLARAQHKLSRMLEQNTSGYHVVGKKRFPIYKRPLEECKNIQKQKLVVARIQKHIANQRLDNLHKTSTEIANQYDVVCVESLNMRAMSNKGFGNGKATMDNGYGMFLNMLEYKLNDRGKYFIKVNKWYPSSQVCRSCGCIHKLELSERTYVCPECGYTIDRDYQAAMNIRDEGLRILKEQLSA